MLKSNDWRLLEVGSFLVCGACLLAPVMAFARFRAAANAHPSSALITTVIIAYMLGTLILITHSLLQATDILSSDSSGNVKSHPVRRMAGVVVQWIIFFASLPVIRNFVIEYIANP